MEELYLKELEKLENGTTEKIAEQIINALT